MQDNLESGYLDFQTNMTANTNATVWIAPVGLAWKAIHDDIVAANGVPTAPEICFMDSIRMMVHTLHCLGVIYQHA